MLRQNQKLTPLFGKKSPTDAPPPTLSHVHLKALRRCRLLLLKDLDPLDVLDRISADDVPLKSDLRDVMKPDLRDVIKPDLRDVIAALRCREQRVAMLLDRLETSDERVFAAFKDALKERYRHVHCVLEETVKAIEDDSDDDNVKERTAIAGETIRRILKDSKRQRSRHVSRRSGVEGEEGAGDDAVDDGDEGRYLDCYVVATRGKLTEREGWIKHSRGVKDERINRVENEATYMGVVTSDVVFKLTERSQISPSLAQILPKNCSHVYVPDEECQYSPANHDTEILVSNVVPMKIFKSSTGSPKHRRSASSRKKATNEIHSAVPPPLPPKPRNLPVVNSLLTFVTHADITIPHGSREEEGHPEMIYARPPERRDSGDMRAVPVALFTQSPPLPVRLPRVQNSLRPKLQLPLDASGTEINEASPASTIIPDDSLASTMNKNHSESQSDDNDVDDDDDEDEISLNFNVNIDDQTEADEPQSINVAVASEVVDKTTVVSSSTSIPESAVVATSQPYSDSHHEYNASSDNTTSSELQQEVVSSESIFSNVPSLDGRASPDSATGKVTARDSGVDSVVSQGYPDSPFGMEAGEKKVYLSASLGDLEIQAAADDDGKSSADYSYYEDIELMDGFLASSIYLNPQPGQASPGQKSGIVVQRLPPSFNFETPPDRKVVPKGALMIVDSQKIVIGSEDNNTDVAQSNCVAEAVEDVVLCYDRDGTAYCVPVNSLARHGDPHEEKWFYPIDLTPKEASLFLGNENQKGCFLVYRPAMKTPGVVYILSVCHSDGMVVHYHIVQNVHGDLMIEGHDHSFMTLRDLIEYFRKNQSRLATRLRRCLKEARLPISPGYHYPQQHELPRNSILLSGKIIGQGKFGVLCQGLYRGTTVSVKVLQKHTISVEEDDFLEEALVMMNLSHDNIVRLHGVCCSLRPFYIVMEFFEKGTLKKCLEADMIPTDNIDVLFDICIQMVSAMAYLEGLCFVLHRDLCAKNFLLTDDMLIKLSNFERARAVNDDNYQASPSDEVLIKWAAPEVLHDSCYSTKSDVWSLGVVFWEVFSRGAEPYASQSEEQASVFVAEGGRLDKPPGCAHDIYAMMKSCWRSSPHDRPSFAALSDKIKGKSSIYYISPLRNHTVSNRPGMLNFDPARTELPLPSKMKTPMNHNRSSSSMSIIASRISTPHRDNNLLRVENSTAAGDKRTSSMSVGERVPTSLSDSSSIISASVLIDNDKEDLTRSDRIRKSLRKLMKKKTPSVSSQNAAKYH